MTNDKAIEKVRQLLALANSSNEHEAANAAARAAEIMERHRIDASMVAEAEQREDEREEALEMNTEIRAERVHKRMPTWYWTLAWAVAQANRTKPRVVYQRDTQAVTFVGKPSNAAAARYMLDAIANDVDHLAEVFVDKISHRTRSAGKAFRLGCAVTIDNRLKRVAQETTESIRGELQAASDESGLARLQTAIAKRDDEARELDQFLRANNVKYYSGGSTSISNGAAYRAGQQAGHSVRLSGGTAALGTGARALPAGGRRG